MLKMVRIVAQIEFEIATNLRGTVTAPNVAMSHEAQDRIRPPPFRVVFQTGGREDGKSINDPTQTLAQDKALKVCDYCFPLVVIRIWKSGERKLGGQESIFWRDSIVTEDGNGR